LNHRDTEDTEKNRRKEERIDSGGKKRKARAVPGFLSPRGAAVRH
jgi:hypothetical protein